MSSRVRKAAGSKTSRAASPSQAQISGRSMASVLEPSLNGTEVEVETLLNALTALRKGDFSVRLPGNWSGMASKVSDTFNDVMDQLESMTGELDRISRVVGKEGKIRQRASVGSLHGAWAGTMDSVNALISDLVHPTSEISRVIGAVAKGDLSQSMDLDIDGRPLEGVPGGGGITVSTVCERVLAPSARHGSQAYCGDGGSAVPGEPADRGSPTPDPASCGGSTRPME